MVGLKGDIYASQNVSSNIVDVRFTRPSTILFSAYGFVCQELVETFERGGDCVSEGKCSSDLSFIQKVVLARFELHSNGYRTLGFGFVPSSIT
jgi:hypothetical protein